MKKTIFLLIALMMILSMFTACDEGGDNLYEESDYDNVSVYRPTDSESKPEDNESKNEDNESENQAEDVSSPALSAEAMI